MNNFLDKLINDFENDNEHFIATFIKAIKSKNKDYVFEAHSILQKAYENVGGGLSIEESIEEREELNHKMKK